MCSNTSSGGAADSADDLGGWTPGSYKRLKRPKIPRRGPGVAELEKILREQEKKDCTAIADNANIDGHFPRFVSSIPDPYDHHSHSLINCLPRPPPPPITITMHPATPTICSSPSRNVSLVPNLAQFSPPPPDPPLMTPVHGNHDSSKTIIGRGGGVFVVGGATVALPKKSLFAISWASSKSNVDGVEGSNVSDSGIPTHIANESIPMSPSPKLLQRKHCQDPSILANRSSPGLATPSSSDAPVFVKPYNHIEPPSNQRSSYNYTSLLPQEVKVHGMTRPKPFSEDNVAAGSQFHFQVPPVIDPRIPTPDQSSSWYSRSAFNVGPSNKVIPRAGTRGDGPSDINTKKFGTTYNTSPDDNLHRFGCLANNPPASMAQSLQREFSILDKLPIRESMEDSDQRSGMGGLNSEKSFHGILRSKEQIGWKEFITLSSNDAKGNDQAGEDEDGIDLDLKL